MLSIYNQFSVKFKQQQNSKQVLLHGWFKDKDLNPAKTTRKTLIDKVAIFEFRFYLKVNTKTEMNTES